MTSCINNKTYFLGIDVAKKTFYVALLVNNKFRYKTCYNTQMGFEELTAWLVRQGVSFSLAHVCLEATGAYSEALANYLHQQGFYVSVVNPAKIKGFAQCQLKRLKSDKADAALIAQYCVTMHPRRWRPNSPEVKILQALVKRLDELITTFNQEKNRLEVAQEIIQSSIRKLLDSLQQEIKAIRKQIQSCIKMHPDLKRSSELLESIPGIGPSTIAQVLAFMGDLSRFENAKQYAAFVGLNPREYCSGSSVRKQTRLSKTGNAALRKVFYMPALVAIKHNIVIQAFSERLKQSGKKPKVIVCAVMRKLVHIIYGILKSGEFFKSNLAT